MLIAKATGVWGDGADEATFNLEVVGNTPSEVEHFRTLVDEPTEVSTKFEKGALKITLSFERKVPLTVQAANQAEALAKAAKDAKINHVPTRDFARQHIATTRGQPRSIFTEHLIN